MAIFLPFKGLCMNTEPTVVSSSRPEHLTMPAFLKRASTAESDVAIAPVWEEAARFPASDVPAFMAAILHPLRIRDEACWSSLSGLKIDSTYISLIRELFSGSKFRSQYSRTSSTPVWALLPTEKTLENLSPLGRADSIMKRAVAPDPETKSQPLSDRREQGW